MVSGTVTRPKRPARSLRVLVPAPVRMVARTRECGVNARFEVRTLRGAAAEQVEPAPGRVAQLAELESGTLDLHAPAVDPVRRLDGAEAERRRPRRGLRERAHD